MFSAGDYQLVSRLHPDAEVWRAYSMKRPDAPVACKYLPLSTSRPTTVGAESRPSDPLVEAKLLTSVCHPNVIEVEDFFVHRGHIGVVMPMALGTLEHPPQDVPSELREPHIWLAGIALGLAALREAGFRHGRLSADHVLIFPDRLCITGLSGAVPLAPERRSLWARFGHRSALRWLTQRCARSRSVQHSRYPRCSEAGQHLGSGVSVQTPIPAPDAPSDYTDGSDSTDTDDVAAFFDVADLFINWTDATLPDLTAEVRNLLNLARARAPRNASDLIAGLGLDAGPHTAPRLHRAASEVAVQPRSPAQGPHPTGALAMTRSNRPRKPPPEPTPSGRSHRGLIGVVVLLASLIIGSGLGFQARERPGPPAAAATQPPCSRDLDQRSVGSLVGVADVDGDGCNEAVYRQGHTVEVLDGNEIDTWRIGSDAGIALLGDWDCDGTATLAVYDPSGWLWRFDGWDSRATAPTDGGGASTRTSPGVPAPADALVRIDKSGDCDDVTFSTTVPATTAPATTAPAATALTIPQVDPMPEAPG
ncbi:MAG: protein kinase family protein [Acidimicrobiia bacterium]|nr:protein kinase family protein [Acidimicrobiia bacterium]